MKVLLLLPLALVASSCIYPEPYEHQRPPYRQGRPGYPYGPDRGAGPQQMPPDSDAYGETGRYERLDGGGNTPPTADNRPSAPRIDDDFQPEGNDTPAPQPTPKPKKEYPYAKAGSKPGEVVSPYPPYKTLEIGEIKSGALAKDPQTGEIFRVP